MRQFFLLVTILLAVLSAAACGFQPVHSGQALNFGTTSQIQIPQIDGRSGHELRKALLTELATGLPGIESATLTITLDERLERLSIRADEAAARTDLIATTRYVLDTGDTAIIGQVSAETNFNVPDSSFGDITAQNSASQRLAGLLARRIADDLKLKLLDTK